MTWQAVLVLAAIALVPVVTAEVLILLLDDAMLSEQKRKERKGIPFPYRQLMTDDECRRWREGWRP